MFSFFFNVSTPNYPMFFICFPLSAYSNLIDIMHIQGITNRQKWSYFEELNSIGIYPLKICWKTLYIRPQDGQFAIDTHTHTHIWAHHFQAPTFPCDKNFHFDTPCSVGLNERQRSQRKFSNGVLSERWNYIFRLERKL